MVQRCASADAARLLATFHRLTLARDEAEMVSALADSVAHLAPAALVLAYAHTDVDGTILATEVAHIWEHGRLIAEHQYYGVRVPASSPLPPATSPSEPLVVADIVENLELAARASLLGLSTRSFIALPLYSKRHRTHQGAVELHWYTSFSPCAADMRYLRALVPIFAEMIAGDRTLRALRQAHLIQQALMARTDWALHEASTRQRMLQEVSSTRTDTLVQVVTPEMTLKTLRESVERAFILLRLGEHGWNISRTAEALDIERTHLHKKLKLLSIERPGETHGG